MNLLRRLFARAVSDVATCSVEKEWVAKISSMSFDEACDAASRLLYDDKMFDLHEADSEIPSNVPEHYRTLFQRNREFIAKGQDFVLGYVGQPEWVPKDKTREYCILGSMGEAGYMVCFYHQSPVVSIMDTTFNEVHEEFPSLYHLILLEVREGDRESDEVQMPSRTKAMKKT